MRTDSTGVRAISGIVVLAICCLALTTAPLQADTEAAVADELARALAENPAHPERSRWVRELALALFLLAAIWWVFEVVPIGVTSLTIGVLQAWMKDAGVDLTVIGLMNLVQIPYTWKFLWAPFMDRWVPPLLGRRRGWMYRLWGWCEEVCRSCRPVRCLAGVALGLQPLSQSGGA